MISVSLLVILLIAAWIAVQYGKAKVGTLILGICLGLAMANTSFGAWGLDALDALLNSAFSGANDMVDALDALLNSAFSGANDMVEG